MIEFEITKGELFCLAAMYGYESLLNIDYEVDEFGSDLAAAFHQISGGLRAKGWLEEDFDGNISAPAHIGIAVALCAAPKWFWRLQVHGKKDVLTDALFNVYQKANHYLVLKQLDGKTYAGTLVEGDDELMQMVKEMLPFPEGPDKYVQITEEELSAVLEGEPYTLVNISKCSLEMGEAERGILCHDVALLLLMEQAGCYGLYPQEEKAGVFLPLNKAEYEGRLEALLAGEEGPDEFAE